MGQCFVSLVNLSKLILYIREINRIDKQIQMTMEVLQI